MPCTDNTLIALLPRASRRRLLNLCEPVELHLADVVSERGMDVRHVYFPTDSFISLVAEIDGKPCLEVGLVGSEGMVGAQVALGISRVPLHAVVQGAGSALRIAAAPFRQELVSSPRLRHVLNRYLYVMMQQLATASPCLRFHHVGPRLSRWLLMSQDRAHSPHFHITHEFLSSMLGVRRVSITVAAQALQSSGFIAYRRGSVQVLDRAGLEGAACSCYAADRLAYSESMH